MDINIQQLLKTTLGQTSQSYDVNNNRVEQNTASNINQAQNINNNSSLIKNLIAGSVLTGFISELNDSDAVISLNDGSLLSATLANQGAVKQGEVVTFIVNQVKDNQISLKVLPADEQQNMFIDKALEAAGLYPTEENTAMVKELLSLNMPVNTDMLNTVNKYMAQFPDSDIKTIANLVRLDMPVTEENINLYKAYETFNAKLDGQLSTMENALSDNIMRAFSDFSRDDIQQLNTVINSMYGNADDNTNVTSKLVTESFSKDFINELSRQLTESSNGDIAEKLNDPSTTTKDMLNAILNNNKITDPAFLPTNKATFDKLLHQFINETMRITPKDVADTPDTLTNYYKRTKKVMEDVENVLKSSKADNDLAKNMSDIKSNIDFMNDLNKNMTFFQMPLKFSDSEGNGDLYVFTNKKALANNPDEVSAMLHLDMPNLGPVDIYVKLNHTNVSTNFILETEELLDFVYAHIDELNERLESYLGERIQDFAEKYLKINPRTVKATFPWGRLFETDITVYDKPVVPLEKELRLKREAEAKAKAEAEAKAKAEAAAKANGQAVPAQAAQPEKAATPQIPTSTPPVVKQPATESQGPRVVPTPAVAPGQ